MDRSKEEEEEEEERTSHKRKRRRDDESCSDSSSTSSSSSSSSYHRKRRRTTSKTKTKKESKQSKEERKRKESKRRKDKKRKKDKKKKRKRTRRHKKRDHPSSHTVDDRNNGKECNLSEQQQHHAESTATKTINDDTDPIQSSPHTPQETDTADQREQRRRRMVPMTKEQYEEKRNEIRQVYDPESGRIRLVRGTGEILERIVSKSDHQAINRTATRGDGSSFARHVFHAASSAPKTQR